jgi:hypothetical protein
MADTTRSVVHAVIVEEELRFTLADLCRACRADTDQLVALVHEGVLEPAGNRPDDWRFAGPASRARRWSWTCWTRSRTCDRDCGVWVARPGARPAWLCLHRAQAAPRLVLIANDERTTP